MNLGPHGGFIVASYAVTILAIAGLIAWVTIDYRAQRRLLADLDAEGVTRRSSNADTPA